MEIVILDSALKHDGITEDRIFSCLYNVRGDKLLDDPPPKRLFAGYSCNGTEKTVFLFIRGQLNGL